MRFYDEIYKYIELLYGLSLILASEFSNFEDLKKLLEQQGIDKIKGIDISKINKV